MRRLFITILSLLLIAGCRTKDTPVSDPEFKLPFHSWAPTPPMGWNSWDCYGPTVTEAEVKANAEYMAKNLKELWMGIYRQLILDGMSKMIIRGAITRRIRFMSWMNMDGLHLH